MPPATGQPWNPTAILSIAATHPAHFNCIGTTATSHANSRCQCRIANKNKDDAFELLHNLPQDVDQAALREIAHRLLCKREHQGQVEEVVERWVGVIGEWKAANAGPPRRRAPLLSEVATLVPNTRRTRAATAAMEAAGVHQHRAAAPAVPGGWEQQLEATSEVTPAVPGGWPARWRNRAIKSPRRRTRRAGDAPRPPPPPRSSSSSSISSVVEWVRVASPSSPMAGGNTLDNATPQEPTLAQLLAGSIQTTTKENDHQHDMPGSFPQATAEPTAPAPPPSEDPQMERRMQQLRENSCPICMDCFTAPCETPCGHVFCSECATDWLKKQQVCPTCRGDTQRGDLSLLWGWEEAVAGKE